MIKLESVSCCFDLGAQGGEQRLYEIMKNWRKGIVSHFHDLQSRAPTLHTESCQNLQKANRHPESMFIIVHPCLVHPRREADVSMTRQLEITAPCLQSFGSTAFTGDGT